MNILIRICLITVLAFVAGTLFTFVNEQIVLKKNCINKNDFNKTYIIAGADTIILTGYIQNTDVTKCNGSIGGWILPDKKDEYYIFTRAQTISMNGIKFDTTDRDEYNTRAMKMRASYLPVK